MFVKTRGITATGMNHRKFTSWGKKVIIKRRISVKKQIHVITWICRLFKRNCSWIASLFAQVHMLAKLSIIIVLSGGVFVSLPSLSPDSFWRQIIRDKGTNTNTTLHFVLVITPRPIVSPTPSNFIWIRPPIVLSEASRTTRPMEIARPSIPSAMRSLIRTIA